VTESEAVPDKHRKRNREFQNALFLEEMRLSILYLLALIIPHSKKVRRKETEEKTKLFFCSQIFNRM